MQIHPKDQIILRNLAALEEAGEQGFSTYHSGDVQAGTEQIKESLSASQKSITSIQDPELRKQAKTLLDSTNAAIRSYMRNPSEENLSNLKADVDAYKDFLDEHQS